LVDLAGAGGAGHLRKSIGVLSDFGGANQTHEQRGQIEVRLQARIGEMAVPQLLEPPLLRQHSDTQTRKGRRPAGGILDQRGQRADQLFDEVVIHL